jgi:hypothetical protein
MGAATERRRYFAAVGSQRTRGAPRYRGKLSWLAENARLDSSSTGTRRNGGFTESVVGSRSRRWSSVFLVSTRGYPVRNATPGLINAPIESLMLGVVLAHRAAQGESMATATITPAPNTVTAEIFSAAPPEGVFQVPRRRKSKPFHQRIPPYRGRDSG